MEPTFPQVDFAPLVESMNQDVAELAVRSYFQLYYDEEMGRVVEEIDGAVRSLIDVRVGLEDKVAEQACIAELEKRGYVILGPYLTEEPAE